MKRKLSVSTNAGGHEYAAIGGDMVDWRDARDGNRDIYSYDLSTRRKFTVCIASRERFL